jgi:hypothetical protein
VKDEQRLRAGTLDELLVHVECDLLSQADPTKKQIMDEVMQIDLTAYCSWEAIHNAVIQAQTIEDVIDALCATPSTPGQEFDVQTIELPHPRTEMTTAELQLEGISPGSEGVWKCS